MRGDCREHEYSCGIWRLMAHLDHMSHLRRTIWGSLGLAVLASVTLSACGTAPASPVVQKSDPAPAESSMVQSLQKQLRERERRIEELESQLNVLKLIDQDVEKRRKPSRPPATLTPVE
jgi:TolA-binding protein